MNTLTPIDKHCDLFTASEFTDLNKAGLILPYDGCGYWNKKANQPCCPDCSKKHNVSEFKERK